jgi:alpha-mannosidase
MKMVKANPSGIVSAIRPVKLPTEIPVIQPARRSFLSITGKNVVLSSVKKANFGEALVLRLYNPSEEVTEAAIQLSFVPADVQLAGLDESPRPAAGAEAAPVREAGGRVRVALAPGKVVTLRVEWK